MADREPEVLAKIASGVAGLNPWAWDRLAGGDPFVGHAFLSALEDSGSVGPGTGWTPAPILVEDDSERLVAAAPAYLKTHSQGEYVFDHGWADAWQRAGGDYYPKLQVAVPFTPVPGSRLLGTRPQQLLAAIEAVTVQNGMSSAHVTFVDHAGAVRRTLDLPSALVGEDEEVRRTVWSPDGSRLAVQTRAHVGTGMGFASNLWLVDRDGGNPRLVHTAAYTGPLGKADQPLGYIWSLVWSPDGSRLGFVEEHARIGRYEESLSMQAVSLLLPGPGEDGPVDARPLYELTTRPFDEAELVWSPDGARVGLRVPDQVLELSARDGRILARHPLVEDDGKPSPQLVWPARRS